MLSNVVQEGDVGGARMALYPSGADWADAHKHAGLTTSQHEDMHGGQSETSILLHRWPMVVRDSYHGADDLADDRRHLLRLGIQPYAKAGIIGLPALASAEKGAALLDSLSAMFPETLIHLRAS